MCIRDRLLIIKEFENNVALVEMYNSDGSITGACGMELGVLLLT